MEYTLVGFSVEIDWRPLTFVKSIPSYRVCGACRLVRKKTALLPCRHTLCESCYLLSARDGGRVCPLDGNQCEEGDVFQKQFPADELLRREVKCWNEGSGCTTVLPASQIGQHFHRECRHHSIRCPKCSATVLCRDVCAHLESECRTTDATAGLERQGDSSHEGGAATLSSHRRLLEVQAGELKILLEQLLLASGADSDCISEVVHGVNSCQETLRELLGGVNNVKETVRKEVAKRTREERDSLKKLSDEIATFSEETKERFSVSNDAIQAISNNIQALEKVARDEFAKMAREKCDKCSQLPGVSKKASEQVEDSGTTLPRGGKVVPKAPNLKVSYCKIFITGVRSIEEKLRKQSGVFYASEQVYLRGYCMCPSVWLQKFCRNIALRASFNLRKGEMDDSVEWPFKQTIKLRVIHPGGRGERVLAEDTSEKSPCCQRPRDGQEQVAFFSNQYLNLEDLIRDGYVEGDQLLIKFDLRP
ncbi:TNF receptor-associated factor 6-like [Amblyomma americanum]